MRRRQGVSDTTADKRPERPSALFLVRCWLEPHQDGEPVLRGYLRDLRSGTEVAISDVKTVEEHVRRQLQLPELERRSDEQKLTA